jgi:hypothetical protein
LCWAVGELVVAGEDERRRRIERGRDDVPGAVAEHDLDRHLAGAAIDGLHDVRRTLIVDEDRLMRHDVALGLADHDVGLRHLGSEEAAGRQGDIDRNQAGFRIDDRAAQHHLSVGCPLLAERHDGGRIAGLDLNRLARHDTRVQHEFAWPREVDEGGALRDDRPRAGRNGGHDRRERRSQDLRTAGPLGLQGGKRGLRVGGRFLDGGELLPGCQVLTEERSCPLHLLVGRLQGDDRLRIGRRGRRAGSETKERRVRGDLFARLHIDRIDDRGDRRLDRLLRRRTGPDHAVGGNDARQAALVQRRQLDCDARPRFRLLLRRDRAYRSDEQKGSDADNGKRREEQPNGSKNAGALDHWREKRFVLRAGISLPIKVCKAMRCSINVCSSLSVSISLARSEAWRST